MGSIGAARAGAGRSSEEPIQLDIISKQILQREMGQTGDEAGLVHPPSGRNRDKLYVATSKAFNINAYLNSDGATIHSENSDWDSLGYNERMIKNDIAKIDSGMAPLTRDIVVSRFVDHEALSAMTGLPISSSTDFNEFARQLESGKGAGEFKDMLRNLDYTHKGYTSTTYTQSHPSFDSREIKLNLVMRKGTPAIISNNDAEHEIVGGRGLKYKFTGGFKVVTTSTGRPQLVLDVEI